MKAFIFLFSMFSLFFSPANAEVVTLRADLWCPYHCDPFSASPGFMVEVAQAAFRKTGNTVDYWVMDWNQAVAAGEAGEFDGLIGTTPVMTPDFIFPTQELALAKQSFWKKRELPWTYQDEASFKDVILVVMDKYSYGEPVDSYIKANRDNPQKIKAMTGSSGRAEAVDYVLLQDRAVFIEETLVMRDFLANSELRQYLSSVDTLMPPIKRYIAFSPKTPKAKEYADIVDAGVSQLKKEGMWEKLLAKYGIPAW